MTKISGGNFQPETVREAAAELLAAAADGEIKSGFDAAVSRFSDPRDKSLLKELVYGSLRNQTALDDLLTRASGHKVFRVDPRLAPILRVAAHQLVHLDRIPAHAAVDEAVNHARRRAGAKRAGFVNAVLRNLVRRKSELLAQQQALPGRGGEALRLGYPQWWLDRFAEEFGDARAAGLAAAFNRPASFAVIALAADAPPPAALSAGPLGSWRAVAGEAADARAILGDGGGQRYYAADLASIAAAAAVAAALEKIADGPVLDGCAAPGGKGLLLRAYGVTRPIAALDLNPSRLIRLRENGRALEHPPAAIAGDLGRAPFRPESFAAVWVDAPCSAAGTLRKHPEKRHTLEPEAPAGFAATQRELLRAAAGLVRPGGLLVYSVCTPFVTETVEVIEDLRAARPEFSAQPLTGAGAELPWEARGDGWLALPDREDWEGFFLTILLRGA